MKNRVVVAAVILAVAILANGILNRSSVHYFNVDGVEYLDGPAFRNYAACVVVGDTVGQNSGDWQSRMSRLKIQCWRASFNTHGLRP